MFIILEHRKIYITTNIKANYNSRGLRPTRQQHAPSKACTRAKKISQQISCQQTKQKEIEHKCCVHNSWTQKRKIYITTNIKANYNSRGLRPTRQRAPTKASCENKACTRAQSLHASTKPSVANIAKKKNDSWHIKTNKKSRGLRPYSTEAHLKNWKIFCEYCILRSWCSICLLGLFVRQQVRS